MSDVPTSIDKYNIVAPINTGLYSVVYRATAEDESETVAVKIFNRITPLTFQEIAGEIAFAKLLNHPNVVNMLGFDLNPNKSYLTMELGAFGTLEDFMSSNPALPEPKVQNYVGQIASALIYMHTMKICHGDLKPENIILCGEPGNHQLKLIDFGISGVVTGNIYSLPSRAGSHITYANVGKQDLPSDFFNLGIIMYRMLYKKEPFAPSLLTNYYPLIKKIPKVKFPQGISVSPEGMAFMVTCFDYEQRQQFTIQHAMIHPYLENNITEGEIPKDHFRSLAELITNAVSLIQQGKFGLALINYFEAILLLKIKFEQLSDEYMKSFVISKIDEYSETLRLLQHVVTGSFEIFPMDDDFAEWEKLRHLAANNPLLVEAIDLGFIGEDFLSKGFPKGISNLRNAVDRMKDVVKYHQPGQVKNLYNRKIEKWSEMLENTRETEFFS